MRGRRRLALIVIGMIVLAVAVFAGWCVWESRRPAPLVETPSPSPSIAPTPSPSPSPVPTPSPTPEPSPSPTPKVILQSILDLRAEYGNDDIVGYLSIPGTVIEYPITQSADNDFYVEHDIYKKNNVAGWLFMDFENDPLAGEDWNTIIYGHNMNRNYMFHSLRYYRDEAFYQAHPYVVYTSMYEKQVWEVYAFYVADVSILEAIKFDYIRVFFDTYAQFERLVGQMKERALYDTGVTFEEGDKILSLSTCTNARVDDRYVLSLVPVKDMSKVPQEVRDLVGND